MSRKLKIWKWLKRFLSKNLSYCIGYIQIQINEFCLTKLDARIYISDPKKTILLYLLFL